MDYRSATPQQNYTIENLKLINEGKVADISGSFISMTIYESLEGLTSGTVSVIDSDSITDILACRGSESLAIDFKSTAATNRFSKTFTITNIARAKNEIGTVETLILSFSNKLLVDNLQNKVTVFKESETISRIVTDILTSATDQPFNVESTAFPRRFTSGISKPIDLIHSLKEVAVTNNSGTFKFFENSSGLQFVSLNTLKSKQPTYTIFSSPSNNDLIEAKENELDATRLVVQHLNNQDTLKAVNGARVVTHSLINKRVEVFDIRADSVVPMNDQLLFDNNDQLYADQPLNNIQLVSSDEFYKNDNRNSYGHSFAKSAVETAHAFARVLLVEVAGCTDLTVGETILLDYTSTSMKIGNLTGKYLINEVKHEFNNNGFISTLEIVTDSEVRRGSNE